MILSFARTTGSKGIKRLRRHSPTHAFFPSLCSKKNQPTSRIAYIMEDHMNHRNMWDFSTNIRDGGAISVGTTIRLHHVKPIDKMMADDCPSLVTSKPAVVLREPLSLNQVPINYQVTAGIPTAFVLNKCTLQIRDSEPIETGCGGLFCDKQRVREVMGYGQSCCCFCFSQPRPNMEIINTVVINHESLDEPLYIEEYSSTRFSLLFQTGVLNSEITKESLDMTDAFDNLQQKIEEGVDLINDNGGFTVIGWYKRGQVNDRTLLIQNTNDHNSKYASTNNAPVQVDSSEIKFHPCVICPSNSKYFDIGSAEAQALSDIKFNVDNLMNIA